MSDRSPIRYVDPRTPRGVLYRAFLRLLATRATRPLFSNKAVWKADILLMRLTRGRLGLGLLLPTGLLETRGARSGRVRHNAVIYFHDGDDIVIVASHAGAPTHPTWYHNTRAHPDVLFNGRPFRAETADEATRPRLWTLADQVFPVYAVSREQAAAAGRDIPVLRLVPAASL